MLDTLYTVQEVAEKLKVSRGYVMSLIYRRELSAIQLPSINPKRAGRWLIREEAISQLLENWENANGQ